MQGLANLADLSQKTASLLFQALYQWNENQWLFLLLFKHSFVPYWCLFTYFIYLALFFLHYFPQVFNIIVQSAAWMSLFNKQPHPLGAISVGLKIAPVSAIELHLEILFFLTSDECVLVNGELLRFSLQMLNSK